MNRAEERDIRISRGERPDEQPVPCKRRTLFRIGQQVAEDPGGKGYCQETGSRRVHPPEDDPARKEDQEEEQGVCVDPPVPK